MWDIIIPIITLIVGLIGGFFIGAFYLRKQMEKMQNDPEALQKMAKQMGYNLNSKQMQRAQQMMKSQQGGNGAGRMQPPMRKNQGRKR
ncbi:YneF family protein [Paenibacillus sp. An7]|uniref:YneF family protein n=1 Tax=Paenibacillus sp. An7 TaxID=2689577 RepID=UPI00135C2780|nr:YneF family protein [Paenibacillus sp. An7]